MTIYVSQHKRGTNDQSSNNVRKKVLWLLWKTVWSHLKKLEMELSHSLATLSGYVSKRMKRKDSGRFVHCVHSRIVSNWSAMKMNEEFICGWKDKTQWHIQEIEYFPDTFLKTYMNLRDTMLLIEVSQSQNTNTLWSQLHKVLGLISS